MRLWPGLGAASAGVAGWEGGVAVTCSPAAGVALAGARPAVGVVLLAARLPPDGGFLVANRGDGEAAAPCFPLVLPARLLRWGAGPRCWDRREGDALLALGGEDFGPCGWALLNLGGFFLGLVLPNPTVHEVVMSCSLALLLMACFRMPSAVELRAAPASQTLWLFTALTLLPSKSRSLRMTDPGRE